MARKSVRVNVNPAVMKWARESAGLNVADVKKVLNLSSSTIEEWEHEGVKKPTLTTLQKLARYYRRPLAVFFLPTPPQEPPMPTDFRFLPDKQHRPLSKDGRLALRRARRVQALATELIEIEGGESKLLPNIGSASLNDDPEKIAERERNRLAIAVEEQLGFRSLYQAFDKWRDALEGCNIVVYQTRILPQEARGFSLLDHMLPTIVVSISDAIAARIFTLFHEYAHLLLGVSGICIPNEAFHDDVDSRVLERFCNHFAGAFLVPQRALEKEECARLINRQSHIDDDSLGELARRFKVSKQVILRRLLNGGLISRDQYAHKLAELLEELEELLAKRRSEKRRFALRPSKRCLLENGRLFTSLVVEAREREFITRSDLSDYLSINLKHMNEVEALLHK